MKLRYKRRAHVSEETHTFRGVVGALIVIALIGWAFHKYLPVLLAKLPPEQTVAVKTVKTTPITPVKASARGPQ